MTNLGWRERRVCILIVGDRGRTVKRWEVSGPGCGSPFLSQSLATRASGPVAAPSANADRSPACSAGSSGSLCRTIDAQGAKQGFGVGVVAMGGDRLGECFYLLAGAGAGPVDAQLQTQPRSAARGPRDAVPRERSNCAAAGPRTRPTPVCDVGVEPLGRGGRDRRCWTCGEPECKVATGRISTHGEPR